jgi:hypothetical protein
VKYFATTALLAGCSDERWLDRVTKAIGRRGRKTPNNVSSSTSQGADKESIIGES